MPGLVTPNSSRRLFAETPAPSSRKNAPTPADISRRRRHVSGRDDGQSADFTADLRRRQIPTVPGIGQAGRWKWGGNAYWQRCNYRWIRWFPDFYGGTSRVLHLWPLQKWGPIVMPHNSGQFDNRSLGFSYGATWNTVQTGYYAFYSPVLPQGPSQISISHRTSIHGSFLLHPEKALVYRIFPPDFPSAHAPHSLLRLVKLKSRIISTTASRSRPGSRIITVRATIYNVAHLYRQGLECPKILTQIVTPTVLKHQEQSSLFCWSRMFSRFSAYYENISGPGRCDIFSEPAIDSVQGPEQRRPVHSGIANFNAVPVFCIWNMRYRRFCTVPVL